ncbi:hypothetical protein CEP54_009997 [Fusarium duplospermum]|uniref:Uncharacterized protein n=1 Tax=Fusarium duplospermum TaxID=1325734 RepID=A0A428PMQ8_9HYPO|nr:hypothetical protein CEP54_009997 [Fusarium duplospermum]
MFGRETTPRQEQSYYSQRGPGRQPYEYDNRDEKPYYEGYNRTQPNAPAPSSNSRKHDSGRSSHLPPPSGRSGESSGYPGVSAGDPRYHDGFHGSHKATPRISSTQAARGYSSPNTNDYRDSAPQKPARQQLNREIESLQKGNKKLEEQVQKLENECGRLKNRVEAMQSAQDAQESRLGRQEQDDSVRQQFNNVFQPIKKWSTNFCNDASQPINMRGISPALTPLVQRVLPGLGSLEELPQFLPVGDKKRRKMFIRGWVALNVSFRILPGPNQQEIRSDLWLPKKEREAVRSLESAFILSSEKDSQSSYHEWRALTFALLDKSFPSTQDRNTIEALNDAVRKTLELIRPMASPKASLYELEGTLCEDIFVPAVELSQVLRRQRAHWYLRFPHMTAANVPLGDEYVEACSFQPDQMTDVDSPEDEDEPGQNHYLKAVDIIILPGLYKCGNNDGEQYEIESVVEKAQVSCTCI